jgi:hypothetical protein
MDATASLRDQLSNLRAVSAHTLRASEHGVLEQLLYKNRSQHRRAPYFHRLEHVRRALRASRVHPAWATVDAAAPHATAPLAFSDVTVHDLEDLHRVLVVAPFTAIPVAARRIVAELVCRGHFLPFSLTIIAVLARLYVIEQQLCAQLAALVSEMRILLACNDSPAAEIHEDVGESVQASLPPPKRLALSVSTLTQKRVAPHGLVHSQPPRLRPPVTVATDSSSLYELLGPDDVVAAGIVQKVVECDTVHRDALSAEVQLPIRHVLLPIPPLQPASPVSPLESSEGEGGNDVKDINQVDDDADIDDIFADLDE